VDDDSGIELTASTTQDNRLLRLRTCARYDEQTPLLTHTGIINRHLSHSHVCWTDYANVRL